MRVSSFMVYDRTTKGFQENFSKLYNVEEKLATGLKISKPSDDVTGLAKVLDYKVDINANAQYARNIDGAMSYLQFSDTAMASLTDNLQRMNELTVQGVSGQVSGQDMQSIGTEFQVIKEAIFALSNSKFGTRYAFSGYSINQSPFVASNSGYVYTGDANKITVNISQTAQVRENVTGTEAFAYALPATTQQLRFAGRTGSVLTAAYTPGTTDPLGRSLNLDLTNGTKIIYEQVDGSPTINVWIHRASDAAGMYANEFRYSNYMDLANLMQNAYNDPNNMVNAQFKKNNVDRLNALMKAVQLGLDAVVNVRAEIGARLNYLDGNKSDNENTSVYLETVKSDVEDADMAATVSDMSKAQLSLQAMRQSSSQVLGQSLLDFLK